MKRRYTRKLLVDPRYQMVQVAVVVGANILVALLIAGLLSWFYLLVWDGAVVVDHNQRIPVYVAIAALIITILTVFFSLRRSRAIAGMMKKIHGVLENADQGRFPERRLAFRKGDYFPELAEPLNRCLEQMRGARPDTELREKLRSLVAEIDDGGVDPVALRRKLVDLIGQEDSLPLQ